MALTPIKLPTNKTFWLPDRRKMQQEIQEIDNLIGSINTEVVLRPNDPAQACFFAFLSFLGNGVLGVMKLAIQALLLQLDLLLVSLEYQVIQVELVRGGILSAERSVTNAIRNAPNLIVQNIYTQVQAEFAKQTKEGQAFMRGLTFSDVMKCVPVAQFFLDISKTVRDIDARLDELDYLVEQETSVVDDLRLAINWARQKKRYFQWLTDSFQFTVDDRNAKAA